jgi:hypothetical protein
MESRSGQLPSLAGPSQGEVKVHPVALFSILDNHVRRAPEQDRVIGESCGRWVRRLAPSARAPHGWRTDPRRPSPPAGGLLGTYSNGVYEVTNAFGVYFTIHFNTATNADEVRKQVFCALLPLGPWT